MFLELTERVASWEGDRARPVLVNLGHVFKAEPHVDGGSVLYFNADAGDRWETLHVRESLADIASRLADLVQAMTGGTDTDAAHVYRVIANV